MAIITKGKNKSIHSRNCLKKYALSWVLYCLVLYCIALYYIVLYCIVLYCIALHCIVLYCIVLYSKVLIGAFISIFTINSKRRRAESFEACSQWALLNVQIITLLFPFTVQKYINILLSAKCMTLNLTFEIVCNACQFLVFFVCQQAWAVPIVRQVWAAGPHPAQAAVQKPQVPGVLSDDLAHVHHGGLPRLQRSVTLLAPLLSQTGWFS